VTNKREVPPPIHAIGFGRQKVFPPVGRCIYCLATNCALGDEHIVPQALGGNMILRKASCRNCERIIGSLEGRLTHKRTGMFATLRLRLNFKSKRPKDRPKSLPFVTVDRTGSRRSIEVPANQVPWYWFYFVTLGSPGIMVGRKPTDPNKTGVYIHYNKKDFERLSPPGGSIEFDSTYSAPDLARFLSKIAHASTVAAHGLDSFEPWLPNFILGKDTCAYHYYVAGHPSKVAHPGVDHAIEVGTWATDETKIAVEIQLFSRFRTPIYQIAVGQFKIPQEM
jgi:hypothetical protein